MAPKCILSVVCWEHVQNDLQYDCHVIQNTFVYLGRRRLSCHTDLSIWAQAGPAVLDTQQSVSKIHIL
ncbi:unnamed protein product [Boreogadus saida]